MDNAFDVGVGFTPLGTIFDFKAAVTGEDMSGEELSPFWRMAGLVPLASEFRKLNRLHHIFNKAEHALGPLVQKFGSEEKAFEAVQQAANQALTERKLVVGKNGVLPSGDNGNIINVGGITVRLIGGRVNNGIVDLSSFSRKGL